jgi:drug/metabolite transporter (DMT)-like permease
MSTKFKGILLTLTGGIFWGFSGVCGQYLFTEKGAVAQWLTSWRLLLSGLLILICIAPKYKKDIFKVFSKQNLLPTLVFCFVSVMGCQYGYFMAISASNAASATVLEYIAPAVVMVYVCLRERHLPTRIQFFALLFAMLGVFFIATGGNIHKLSMSGTALFWGLLSGICYGIYTIQSPSLSSSCGVLPMLGWGNLIGSLPLFILNHEYTFSYTPDFGAGLAFLGTALLGTILSFGVYIKGCKLAGPVTGSLCASIEPLSSAVISYVWLGTTLKSTDIVGLVLIICTVILLTLNPTKNKNLKEA